MKRCRRSDRISYFNPRPREEGDRTARQHEGLGKISIHALVKRATSYKVKYEAVKEISIHALVKRATDKWRQLSLSCRNFNPRPREEGDCCEDCIHCRRSISIHALVKRATVSRSKISLSIIYFNPRPREEGDSTFSP